MFVFVGTLVANYIGEPDTHSQATARFVLVLSAKGMNGQQSIVGDPLELQRRVEHDGAPLYRAFP